MASAAQDAKLKYLEASATMYACTSAPMSARLMLQRDLEVSSLSSSSHATDFITCKACGTTLLPGLTSKTTIESLRTANKCHDPSKCKRVEPVRIDENLIQKWVRVECLTCHRYTKIALNAAKGGKLKSRQTSTVHIPRERAATHPSPATPLKASTSNVSSKQRAKARRQGGLSAMLEKSKADSAVPPGLGLDLMDLMKQD